MRANCGCFRVVGTGGDGSGRFGGTAKEVAGIVVDVVAEEEAAANRADADVGVVAGCCCCEGNEVFGMAAVVGGAELKRSAVDEVVVVVARPAVVAVALLPLCGGAGKFEAEEVSSDGNWNAGGGVALFG